jgi:plasmid replication initiation protein
MRNRLTKKPKAMRELTFPGCDVKKANTLVRSKISITDALGSRLLASLIACIRPDDTEFLDVYEIPVNKVTMRSDGKSYTEIKKVCRALQSAFAERETKVNGKPKFETWAFFGHIEYHDGTVKARFNADLGPMLLALQGHFTKYNLLEYLKLPSIYSQRIFEILKSWGDKPEVTISLIDLHNSLNTPATFRANFKNFRIRVLEKAHKDITEKTCLRYEWEPVKKGRGVVAVRFIFGRRLAIAAAAQASSQTKEQEKRSAAKNKDFKAFVACRQERGQACEGGHQKAKICELCRNFR